MPDGSLPKVNRKATNVTRVTIFALGVLSLVLVVLSILSIRLYPSIQSPAQVIMMTAVVPGCGNGLIEANEECDGSELANATCQSIGFDDGTLSCTKSCLYNVTACFNNIPAPATPNLPQTESETDTTLTSMLSFFSAVVSYITGMFIQ